MWFNTVLRGLNDEATLLSDELVAIARELDNPDLLMEAYHAKVPMLLSVPDFKGVVEAAQQVIRLYNRERHRDHAYYFGGHDARMCARSFYAYGLWAHGLFEQARQASWQAIEDARALGHLFSLAHALQRGGLAMALMGDAAACRTLEQELYPIAERNKFPWQLMDARFLRGWLAAQEGDFEGGIEAMSGSKGLWGNTTFGPMYIIMILEQELGAGRSEHVLASIERTDHEANSIGFCAPELHRLRGEALRAQAPGKDVEAECAFREALALARRQSCRPLELRAAVSLARLLRDGEHSAEAREVLVPIYDAFTEGFSLPDLQNAKKLIAELNS
jgi:predicted ATPase